MATQRMPSSLRSKIHSGSLKRSSVNTAFIAPAVFGASLTPQVLPLDGLQVEELAQAVGAELAPMPRRADAAERGERVERAAVDVDLAGPQPPRDTHRAGLVRGPDGAGEPVVGVVGDP